MKQQHMSFSSLALQVPSIYMQIPNPDLGLDEEEGKIKTLWQSIEFYREKFWCVGEVYSPGRQKENERYP